jgi:hypothetical protein
LEKLVGEIKRGGGLGLAIVVEGLNSIGLEGSKVHPMLISPSHPFSKEKANGVVNKHKDQSLQHLKLAIHLKPSFKWALNKWTGESLLRVRTREL